MVTAGSYGVFAQMLLGFGAVQNLHKKKTHIYHWELNLFIQLESILEFLLLPLHLCEDKFPQREGSVLILMAP